MAIDVKYIEKHGDIWRTYDGIWRYLMVFTRNTYDDIKKIYADVQIWYETCSIEDKLRYTDI